MTDLQCAVCVLDRQREVPPAFAVVVIGGWSVCRNHIAEANGGGHHPGRPEVEKIPQLPE